MISLSYKISYMILYYMIIIFIYFQIMYDIIYDIICAMILHMISLCSNSSICPTATSGSSRCGSGITATHPRLCRPDPAPALPEKLAPHPLSLGNEHHPSNGPGRSVTSSLRCSPRIACCRCPGMILISMILIISDNTYDI